MIGVDIVQITRIKNTIKKFGDKFLNRWFHKDEIIESKNNSSNQTEYFAKRFAAKEAFLKARGHGLELKFSDICVKKNEYGKPFLFYQGKKLENTEISLSDDGDYAIAFVLIKPC